MSSGTFVLAVLGESPSVLTELLWWLRHVEGQPIAGVEVWTTTGGLERLTQWMGDDRWKGFLVELAPFPEPDLEGAPSAGFGFRVHRFVDPNGNPLRDVRSQDESSWVGACLHDRVRALRAELSDRIPIVASLAGGRKTASAALQTAMCLQAGPLDRLVHVLLDARLETYLRGARRLGDFLHPTAEWASQSGVAQQDQLVVYDVHFPRVRHLVARRMEAALDGPYDEIWPALEANLRRSTEATLYRPDWSGWRYEVRDTATGELLYQTALTERLGALFAAMCETPDDARARDLVAWLDESDVGWAPSGTGNTGSRQGAIRTGASNLREALSDLEHGLEAWMPPEEGFDMRGVVVDMRPRLPFSETVNDEP